MSDKRIAQDAREKQPQSPSVYVDSINEFYAFMDAKARENNKATKDTLDTVIQQLPCDQISIP